MAAPTRRQLVYGSSLGAAIALGAALLWLVNYLSWRHYERFDWTTSQLYSLSEQTTNILAGLEQDVDVVVFMDPQSELYPPVRELLARYAAASDHVEVRTVDPVKNRAEAVRLVEQYDIQRAEVIVFLSGGERRVVEAGELADYDYSAMQMGGAPEMTAFKGEPLFTGAIVALVEREKPRILFTTGHGEISLDAMGEGRGLSQLQDLLGRDNFEIEEWASLGADGTPAGTDLVVVASPTSPFTEPELAALGAYLEGGGRLLVLLDPILSETRQLAQGGLPAFLAGYGVAVDDAIAIDPAKLLPFFGAETIFADAYGTHPIVDPLRQARLPVLLALVRPVRAAGGDGPVVDELVRTSPDGWGERGLDDLSAVEQGSDDLAGPVSLGVAVELAPAENGGAGAEAEADGTEGAEPARGRLVVLGDADFLTDAQITQVGNATLAANTFNWLVERESHLGIAPKTPEQSRLTLTPQQRRLFFWLVVAALPAAALAAGVAITLRRRR